MPSWVDDESSIPSSPSTGTMLDLVPMDYAPDFIEDPLYNGVDVGCGEVCRVHKLPPQKCVSFEGSNTGRRFYLCQVGNQVMNCGFHSWIDHEEWPETLQRALSRLWAMYHEENRARIDDGYESAVALKQVSDEKQKLEKKYNSLLDDVKKFMDETERKVLKTNYQRCKEERKEEKKEGRKEVLVDGKLVEETAALKNEVEVLKNAVNELKNIIKTQGDVMKAKSQKYSAEKLALKSENEALKAENENLMAEKATIKAEKKKVEHMLLQLFNAKHSLYEKVKKIKAICEDE